MAEVITVNGKKLYYYYNADGLLNKIVNSANNYIEIKYAYELDTAKTKKNAMQVAEIKTYSGENYTQTIRYDYSGHNVTVITGSGTQNDIYASTKITTTKQFDDFGRLISSYDVNSGQIFSASTCTYVAHASDTDKTKHHVATVGDLGMPTLNLLRDGSFEKGSSYWYNSGDISGSLSSANSTAQSMYGKTARKMTIPAHGANNRYRVMQDVDLSQLKADTYYTLSAYVKVTTVSADAGGGVFIHAKTESSEGNPYYYSEYITAPTNTAVDNGWQRLSVSFKTPSAAMTKCYVGLGVTKANATVYFDAVQLEEGDTANTYNLLENAGFQFGSYGWTLPSGGSFVTGSAAATGKKSYKIAGNLFGTRSMHQEINLSADAKKSDTYIVSLWTKANAVGAAHDSPSGKITRYCIEVMITYTDGTKKYKLVNANPSVYDWQFVAGGFNLDDQTSTDRKPTKVRILAAYYYQPNYIYLDTFSLTKENVATFAYDGNGNMKSTKELATANQKLSYTVSNDLQTYEDGVGDTYKYTHDSKHNLTQAKSNNGVKYNYSYNGNGGVTQLKVGNTANGLYMQSNISYTDNNSLISSVTEAAGNATSYTYDNAGRTATVTDPRNTVTTYSYDGQTGDLLGVSSAVTLQGSAGKKTVFTSYTYNESGNLTRIGAHNKYDFSYDASGNLLTATAGDSLLVTNTYNPNDTISKRTYGNGLVQQYQYDSIGRLSALKYGTKAIASWSYDGKSRVKLYVDIANKQKHVYNYDVTGRFARESVQNVSDNARLYASEYGYDQRGNVNYVGVVAGTNGGYKQWTNWVALGIDVQRAVRNSSYAVEQVVMSV